MLARDIMTVTVIAVTAETSVPDVANILIANRISAVPVVDGAGAPLGIVSEGDLMRRPESGTEPQHSWWLRLIESPRDHAVEYVKSHGLTAGDVMTAPAITVAANATVGEIARLLDRRHIKRVPVVSNGRIIGIVSRSNLIQALAGRHGIRTAKSNGDDRQLRQRIIDEIGDGARISVPFVNVIVTDGMVELRGNVSSNLDKAAVRVAAESIAGREKVSDHVSVWSASARAVLWAE